ncbi:MAG: membrane protein [Clostridia bacterium]|nr:membrane protein [Clostridia bacterium]
MVFIKKFLKLMLGLSIFSVGIVLTIHSQLGATPWDVFHLGLRNYSSLTLGQISQIVGLIIIIVNITLGEIPGIATLFNMYFIGLFIDLLQGFHLIPLAKTPWQQFLMLFSGLYLFGWGSYFYMEAGLGAGPRDSLMGGLMKKTKQPVWKIRAILELSVLAIGYFMGGVVGIGTVLSAILIGVSIEHVYKVMKGDPAQTKHQTFKDYYLMFKKIKNTKNNPKETTIG